MTLGRPEGAVFDLSLRLETDRDGGNLSRGAVHGEDQEESTPTST